MIASCAASASNLLGAVTKGRPVSAAIILAMSASYLVFKVRVRVRARVRVGVGVGGQVSCRFRFRFVRLGVGAALTLTLTRPTLTLTLTLTLPRCRTPRWCSGPCLQRCRRANPNPNPNPNSVSYPTVVFRPVPTAVPPS